MEQLTWDQVLKLSVMLGGAVVVIGVVALIFFIIFDKMDWI